MDPTALSVTILGCDGSFPGPAGACSGYLIRSDETNVWMDAGSGTMSNLQAHVRLQEVDAVIITHEHPDHWTDLEGLAIAFKWSLRRDGPVVFAPAGLRELMRVGAAADVFRWQTIDEGSVESIGPLQLSFSRTDHSVPTFAVRAESRGRALGYSADTGPGWGLSQLGRDINLALCEATFLADKEGTVQHLSARQAGSSAAKAQVERLVITHITPGVDRDAARIEATASFGGSVEVAAIGTRYEV
ncbi:MAG TPA: MBL fold metallo-hydrolase [Acidimicrobiales bacterium]|nr:MBL fold metallo-hydrolase [Acidimicrobiales bacterium]